MKQRARPEVPLLVGLLCCAFGIWHAAGSPASAAPMSGGTLALPQMMVLGAGHSSSVGDTVDVVGINGKESPAVANDAVLAPEAAIERSADTYFPLPLGDKLDLTLQACTSATGITGGRRRGKATITNSASATVNPMASTTLYDLTTVGVGEGFPYRTGFTLSAAATGIDACGGKDVEVTNDGVVSAQANVNAWSDPATPILFAPSRDGRAALYLSANASATGIAVADTKDTVTNTGTIEAWAGSTLFTSPSMTASAADHRRLDAEVASVAQAVGVDASNARSFTGVNTGTVDAQAAATLPLLPYEGGNGTLSLGLTSDVAYTAATCATGIRLGAPKDPVENSGSIWAAARSVLTVPDLVVDLATQASRCGGGGGSSSATYADITFDGIANAIGIDATNGPGRIQGSAGEILADAQATLDASATGCLSRTPIQLTLGRRTRADVAYRTDATAVGVALGTCDAALANDGSIVASANALTTAPAVGGLVDDEGLVHPAAVAVDGGGSEGALVTNAATASAAGVTNERSTNDLTHASNGFLKGSANANARGGGANLSVAPSGCGVVGLDAGQVLIGDLVSATAAGAGVLATASPARLQSDGTVLAEANAGANQQSVSLSLSRLRFSTEEQARTAGVATVAAAASATGISSGTSGSQVNSAGMLSAQALSNAAMDGSLNVTLSGVSVGQRPSYGGWWWGGYHGCGRATATRCGDWDGCDDDNGAGLVVTDASVTADASATGILGGDRPDALSCNGFTQVDASAIAAGGLGTYVSVGEADGGAETYLEGGAVLVLAGQRASAMATGVDGGSGAGELTAGSFAMNVAATSAATASAVTVDVYDEVTGGSSGWMPLLADASATAYSSAVGLAGGSRSDTLTNSGSLSVTAQSDVFASGTPQSVSIYGGGSVDTAKLLASAVSAEATAVGLSGGGGTDEIASSGDLLVSATASAQHDDVVLTVEGTLSGGEGAAIDATTRASALAIGIESGSASGRCGGSGGCSSSTDAISVGGSLVVTASSTAVGAAESGDAAVDTSASATATAIGVRAGDSTSQITLGGVANVTALAGGSGATSATAYGVLIEGSRKATIDNQGITTVMADAGLAKAIGIATGSGSDLVQNSGTLRALANGVSGIAIDTGAGNDQVVLADGSETEGSILLGSGNDRLTVVGTAHVTVTDGGKLAYGGSGCDTLDLGAYGGDQFVSGSEYESFETLVKRGQGTTRLTDMPQAQNLTVAGGLLSLAGDYRFAADGTTTIRLGSGLTGGQLRIDEAAQLAGSLALERGTGAYLDGATYNILQAGSIVQGSDFSLVSLPKATPLLSFGLERLSDGYQVRAHTNPFASVANGEIQTAVAQYLDRITPLATGQLSALIGEFQAAPAGGHAGAFSSLSPESYEGSTAAALDAVLVSTGMAGQRMSDLRRFQRQPGLALTAALPGLRGAELAGVRDSLGPWRGGSTGTTGMWAAQHSSCERGLALPGYTGGSALSSTTAFGFDRRLGTGVVGGVSADCSNSRVSLDGAVGSGLLNTYGGGLYGTAAVGRYYLEGTVHYATLRSRNFRRIAVGQASCYAASRHDGDALSASLGIGRSIDEKGWAISPSAMLRYTRLGENAFQESGAGDAGLLVSGRRSQELAAEMGVRVERSFTALGGRLVPDLSLAWSYDLGLRSDGIGASFTGAADDALVLPGVRSARQRFALGAGLSFLRKDGTALLLRYHPQMMAGYRQGQAGWGAVAQVPFN